MTKQSRLLRPNGLAMTRDLLQQAKLYVVLDSHVADFEKLFVILKKTVAAGTKIVQLRSKHGSARDILAFSKRALTVTKGKALFIVNDRADLALLSNSDGIHLGQDDLTLKEARKILGPGKIIGVSCQTVGQAKRAQEQGADYIGFGSVFKTKTKPERKGLDLKIVSQVSRQIKVPVFFIGGITLYNLGKTVEKGGKRIAVTRAICEAVDVAVTTKEFLKVLRHCEEPKRFGLPSANQRRRRGNLSEIASSPLRGSSQ